MKEPFINVDTLIDQTKLLGDMELQAYLSTLNDSQKSEFMAGNVNEAINAVNDHKSSRFIDLIDQATGADNNVTSAAYYLARTRDLTSFAKDVDEMTVKQLNIKDINAGLAGRQYEINEWANNNKLDTLYFMQILFICLSILAICAYLLSQGILSPSTFTFISYAVAFIAIVMLIIRWRFTRVVRDSRYWHKERFAKPASALKDAPNSTATPSNSSCSVGLGVSYTGPNSSTPSGIPLRPEIL
jgi:hypothetical protein